MGHRWGWVKQQWASYKAFFYTGLLMAVLAFLGKALFEHWQAITTIRITLSAWACFAIATGITLLAFTWTGWVWGWILEDLGHPVSNVWATQIYLTTNIAKYLPSNLVHLYGRTLAANAVGIPLSAASLSVILDTLLMISAGLILGLLSVPQSGVGSAGLGLMAVLVIMHPVVLRSLGQWLTQLAAAITKRNPPQRANPFRLLRYPWRPLLGEISILILRGLGFTLVVQALIPLGIEAVPRLISIFSIGWLLGFITPGVPGGVGVFELTVSQLMIRPGVLTDGPTLSYGLALGSVALYRLMNTLAEAIGAGLAWLDTKHSRTATTPILRSSLVAKPNPQNGVKN
ncbi:lysylphosphatidylglycerol synthase domain-containing protein [Acaryochloris sp. IP29b_bin.148]|uniref:lysylphosphatidylglycerol synthase domain-containing protein n=1 Tax=Acaryochloris sp. IP29b_bin.148 TaxID=2969218 RepID=UPI00262AAF3A|nr:lysylphosphatidylglycerol synthase domain-containing protein [Acaryochloris sp. IP29b_bin.148]